ncbi:hypothetical protein HAHI6034_05115 [Hathewaya histolytica]|uniref:Uncharacterized protein n=1 Tax=Hathewaya histolytica TaxID=1498 RepID=A0A4U9RDN6_HATHI|nr:hypothetical protein [Hathewaya histolytica]VTQ86830.1 Uncharacterised protein [Hathewaya histolytica]
MRNNNMELLNQLLTKVQGWKKTQNITDMKTYFTEVFVSDLFLECQFDYYIEKILKLIKNDIFDVDYFLKMNRKYPNSMFHDYIRRKGWDVLVEPNFKINEENRRKWHEMDIEEWAEFYHQQTKGEKLNG